MTCPFKVGDRIHELRIDGGWVDDTGGAGLSWRRDPTKPDATVTALTARGFEYRYDKPIPFGRAAWGQSCEGGECFEEGFQFWRRVDEPPLKQPLHGFYSS